MNLTRPHLLYLQRRDSPRFSLEDLMAGGAGLAYDEDWIALAPHLEAEVLLEPGDLPVFEAVSTRSPALAATLEERFGAARISRLVQAGLLLSDAREHDPLRTRNQAFQELGWWGPAALAHRFGRWQRVDTAADEGKYGKQTLSKMMAGNGQPPAEVVEVRPRSEWQALPTPAKSVLDDLLAQRSTCRNFDPDFHLPCAELSTLLHRVFGAQATQTLAPGAVALKKNSPSGGGLHPIDAYLLVQRVDGLAPGIYHYQCIEHMLEPMHLVSSEEAARVARELVAGQDYFANAPVLLLMAARFDRNYWKYRRHAKAWRVIQLDAGHLSQNLYLTATELGYGAFITGAINDECAERLFELDGIRSGAVAVCGFGRRTAERTTVEFDPLGRAVGG